jgi:hypothetical protein
MLMTMYSTGVRRAELCQLKTSDIDSQRMVVHIHLGKGRRDRDVPLSPALLEELRAYWRWMKPKTFLFPGVVDGWRADVPISDKAVWFACQRAARAAGIEKHISPHTLRHSYATHMHEAGAVLANSYILEGRGSMNTADIIVEIDAQISRLQEAKALLAGPEITVKRKPGRPSRVSLPDKGTRSISAKSATKPAARRTLSAEARAKIATAQKARWARARKAAKKATRSVAAAPAVKGSTPNGTVPKTAPAKKAVSAKKAARPKTKTPVTPAA